MNPKTLTILLIVVIAAVGITYFVMSQNKTQMVQDTQYSQQTAQNERREKPQQEKEMMSSAPMASPSSASTNNNNSLANPASVNCTQKGGTLTIQTRGDGGQYGLCTFEDNMQCEEWALYRGECPVGGLNVIGYDNPQEVYCAITGGQTLAVSNPQCKFKDGSVCSDIAYYNGQCQPGQNSQ